MNFTNTIKKAFNLPRYISLVLVLFATSCMGQSNFEEKVNSLLKGTVPQVRVGNLDSLMLHKKPILLDTRSPKEFEVSHMKDARFVDYDQFEPTMVQDIPRDTPIVVYCSVGYRSEKIGEKLQELGFTEVYNLHGGIFDWKNKGNQVVNPEGIPTDSVHTYNKNWSKWLVKGTKVYE